VASGSFDKSEAVATITSLSSPPILANYFPFSVMVSIEPTFPINSGIF